MATKRSGEKQHARGTRTARQLEPKKKGEMSAREAASTELSETREALRRGSAGSRRKPGRRGD